MLIYPVVVILWIAVTTIATPATDYVVKQSVDDKETSDYRYHYKIDDGSDENNYGKIEMKNGELASGHYYINDERSSTDVKYTADELGYHPVVKYRSMNDDSNIKEKKKSTISEYAALKPSFNDSNIEDPVKLTGDGQAPLVGESVPIDQDNKRDDETTFAESSTSISFVTNYMSNPEVTKNLEDSLVIENSGSFGQRVPDKINTDKSINSNDKYKPQEIDLTTATVQPVSSIYHSMTIKPDILSSNNTYNSALESIRKYLGLPPSRKKKITEKIKNFLTTSDQESVGISFHDIVNNSTEDFNDNTKNFMTLKMSSGLPKQVSTRFTKPIVVAEVSNLEQYEYSTTFPCSDDKDNNDDDKISVTSPIDTVDSLSSKTTTENSLPSNLDSYDIQKVDNYDRITTSSLILNPIQAGISLVNSGDTQLIVGEHETTISSTTPVTITRVSTIEAVTQPTLPSVETPTESLNDKQFNKPEILADENNNQDIKEIKMSDAKFKYTSYENIYSDNNKQDNSSTSVTTNNNDPTFEIQKSVELYHSSPIQEIHYPGQLSSSQVSNIDHSNNQEYYPYQQYYVTSTNQYDNSKFKNNNNNNNNNYHDNQKREQSYFNNQPELMLQELQTNPEEILAIDSEKNVLNFVVQDDIKKINVNNDNNSLTESVKFSESSVNQQTYLGELNEYENSARENGERVEKTTVGYEENIDVQNGEKYFIPEKNIVNQQQQQQQHIGGLNNEYLKKEEDEFISSTILPGQEFGTKLNKETIQASHQYPFISTVPTKAIEIETIGKKTPFEIENNIVQEQTNLKLDYSIENNNDEEKKLYYSQVNTNANNNYQNKLRNVYENNVVDKPVGVEQSYSFPIEKEEIKYPSNKFIESQGGYPVHILQYYPSETLVEKPVNIPIGVVNKMVVENKVVQIPLQTGISIKPQYPMFDVKKYIKNSVNTFNSQHQYNNVYQKQAINLQNQINQQQQEQPAIKHESYQNFQRYEKPLLQLSNSRYIFNKRYASFAPNQQKINNLQQATTNICNQQLNHHHQQQQPVKNYLTNQLSYSGNYQAIDQTNDYLRQQILAHCSDDKVKVDDYHGPVPLPQHVLNLHQQQNQVLHPVHQETLRLLANSARFNPTVFMRRTKLPEVHSNFRQSKMEYGFKPPMVPSVQYDEQTATRVDN